MRNGILVMPDYEKVLYLDIYFMVSKINEKLRKKTYLGYLKALITYLVRELTTFIKVPLGANPCRSVYIAHKMVADGVFSTPSDAILWAIYTDLYGSATTGADLKSSQLSKSYDKSILKQRENLSLLLL